MSRTLPNNPTPRRGWGRQGVPLLLALVAVSLVACSEEASAPPTTSAAASELTAEEARVAVRDVVLTQDDVGTGWQAAPPQEGDAPDGSLDFRDCMGEVDMEADGLTPPVKFGFVSGAMPPDITSVSGSTTAFTQSDVDDVFEMIGSEAFKTCVTDLASQGGEASAFDGAAMSVREKKFGSAEHGVEVTIPFSANLNQSIATQEGASESTTAVPGALTIDFISEGQILSVLAVLDLGARAPASEIDRWATLLADRQSSAN